MITAPPRGQDVEWGYAFDVHLNAFFPLLMILHLFQLVFLHRKLFISSECSGSVGRALDFWFEWLLVQDSQESL